MNHNITKVNLINKFKSLHWTGFKDENKIMQQIIGNVEAEK